MKSAILKVPMLDIVSWLAGIVGGTGIMAEGTLGNSAPAWGVLLDPTPSSPFSCSLHRTFSC